VSKKRWFIGTLVGLLVVTLAVSAAALAQGPRGGGAAPNGTLFHDEDGDGVCDYCGNTPRTRGGWGMMGGGMMRGGWGDRFGLVDVVAEVTETERAEVIAALQDGQTLAEYLAEHGGSVEEVVDAALAARAEALAAAVENGRITQEQADAMLAHMEEQITEHLNGEWDMPCLSGAPGARAGGRGRGFGRPGGMMRGRFF
jgi:hypothetical protein